MILFLFEVTGRGDHPNSTHYFAIDVVNKTYLCVKFTFIK